MSNNFITKFRTVYVITRKNMVQPGRSQKKNTGARALHAGQLRLQILTQNM